jgi:simple sugar transport system ATP-binding protein
MQEVSSNNNDKDLSLNPLIPLLSLKGITKKFPDVLANDHIDLDIYGKEIHALLGENGAGKSTLMKILYGFYRADSGEIRIDGELLQIRSPYDARKAGIGMVFQDFTLIPAFTVAENIALFLPQLKIIVNIDEICKKIQDIAEYYDLSIDPHTPVWQLSIGQQQKVEILKLLLSNTRILILDEPTKVLAPNEVDGLFRIFQKLRNDGYAIIFITHKMREVLSCSDRISVLRHGKLLGKLLTTQADEKNLVSLMFGEELPKQLGRIESISNEKSSSVLSLNNLSTASHDKISGLKNINLEIFQGQIIGVAGISGNGQKELGDVVLGLEEVVEGQKILFGNEATNWSTSKIRSSGVAFIPEDPLLMAAIPSMTILENVALGNINHFTRKGGFSLDWFEVKASMENSLKKVNLQIPPFKTRIQNLSGGNVQRAIIARELAHEPKLIVAFYPTRGLDVKSTQSVREVLLAACVEGASVLLFSEDLSELFSLSDQIAVMYHSKIVGLFKPEETNINEIGKYMTGMAGGK